MTEHQRSNNEATAEIIMQMNKRIDAIEKHLQALPTEQRIAEIVHETLISFFTTKGTTAKSILIGTALVIGALTVIFGGLKAILGWLGFSYVIK